MMVKKNRAAKQTGPVYQIDVPPEGIRFPAHGALKDVRERVGLTQPALAQECGVSRNVIANYESGRTKLDPRLSFEDALKVWRVLEVKERGLGSGSLKKGSAADYLLGLLWWAKESARSDIFEIDGRIANLKRKQDSLKHRIDEIDSEASALRGGSAKALP
jgi:transcriptional regulator with XRE-family HTH domain